MRLAVPVLVALLVWSGLGRTQELDTGSPFHGPTATEPYIAEPADQFSSDDDHVPNEIVVKLKPSAVETMRTPLAAGRPALDTFPDSVRALNHRFGVARANEMFPNFREHNARMVQLRRGRSPNSVREQRLLRRMRRAPRNAEAPSLEGIYRVQFDIATPLQEVLDAYRTDPNVEYAEPNAIVRISATPDDPLFNLQWSLNNTGQIYPASGSYNAPPGTPDADMDAPEAWDAVTDASSVIVAVIDTGVDYTHRDLAANMWVNEAELNGTPGVDDDANGYIDDIYGYDFTTNGQIRDSDPIDVHGHGTHCAGIIGAVGNNAQDIAGVAWSAKVMALKHAGSDGAGYLTDATDAIYYAVANGADILSMSWEVTYPQSYFADAIAYAASQGVFMCAAAGNSNGSYLRWPARFYEVLGVGATSSNDDRAPFSNYAIWTEIAAPGVDVLSLRATGLSMGTPYDAYTTTASGTSMACPHVAGVAALVLAQNPTFSPDEVRSTLKMTSDPYSSTYYIGQGRVNTQRALTIASPPAVAFLDMEGLMAEQGYAVGNFDIRGTAKGNGFASYSLYYGSGNNPSSWFHFYTGTTPVDNDVLFADFDPAQLPDGLWTLKLVVSDINGFSVEDLRYVRPKWFFGTYPMDNDILKPGGTIGLRAEFQDSLTLSTVEYGTGWYPEIWNTTGFTIDTNPEDDVLANWDTTHITENGFYSLRYTFSSPWGSRTGFVRSFYFDTRLKEGWPQYVIRDNVSEGRRSETNFTVTDLDGDGRYEVIAVEQGLSRERNPVLRVFADDGSERWSRVLDHFSFEEDLYRRPSSSNPIAGDVDGDGYLEVFIEIGCDSVTEGPYAFYGFRWDGSDLPGWPIELPRGNGDILLADVTGDGSLELVIRSGTWYIPSLDGVPWPCPVYVVDSSGSVMSTFLVASPGQSLGYSKLAVGNFDADPALEIATFTGERGELSQYDGRTYPAIFNSDGTLVDGWPKVRDSYGLFALAAGDIDGDGKDELITAHGKNYYSGLDGGFFALDSNGNILPGWPIHSDLGPFEADGCGVSLADIDRDGDVEICISRGNTIGLYDQHANPLPGWPITFSNGFIQAKYAPLLADITGDGSIDVVVRAGALQPAGMQGQNWTSSGGIWAWHQNGTPILLNPDNVSVQPLWLELWYKGRCSVADLDGNGTVELIGSSHDNLTLGDWRRPKWRDSFYVFELDSSYRPDAMAWPSWLGGPTGSNRYAPSLQSTPIFVRILGADEIMEDQTTALTAVARFATQQTQFVTADLTWNVDSPYASIDANGVLTAGSVNHDTPVTATATLGDVSGEFSVLIKEVSEPRAAGSRLLRDLFLSADADGSGCVDLIEATDAGLDQAYLDVLYPAPGDQCRSISDLLAFDLGVVGEASPVYVDFDYNSDGTQVETGTDPATPFNTLLEAFGFVRQDGTGEILIAPGDSGEVLVEGNMLNPSEMVSVRRMDATDGSVRVGVVGP